MYSDLSEPCQDYTDSLVLKVDCICSGVMLHDSCGDKHVKGGDLSLSDSLHMRKYMYVCFC
jgi:hypothetical protein